MHRNPHVRTHSVPTRLSSDLGVARNLYVIDIGGRGDFAGQYDQTCVAQGFGCYAGIGILRKNGVKDGVGNLIRDFVEMAFGNRFGSKKEIVIYHSDTSYIAPVARLRG